MKALTLLLAGTALLSLPFLGGGGDPALAPATVTIPPGSYAYRPVGDFYRGGVEVDPPLERRAAARPLEIMAHPVSGAEYSACVAAGACAASTERGAGRPQVDVSYEDAVAYADWLSDVTGQDWRLPTDDEWVRAAGERALDEALGADASNPAVRWLAEYGMNAERRDGPDLELRPLGSWGENAHGVADLSGNVWEWTSTCTVTAELDAAGAVIAQNPYCGVRVAEGRHRALIIDFVRDARRGGCAAGLPPDYLGFRLVRD